MPDCMWAKIEMPVIALNIEAVAAAVREAGPEAREIDDDGTVSFEDGQAPWGRFEDLEKVLERLASPTTGAPPASTSTTRRSGSSVRARWTRCC